MGHPELALDSVMIDEEDIESIAVGEVRERGVRSGLTFAEGDDVSRAGGSCGEDDGLDDGVGRVCNAEGKVDALMGEEVGDFARGGIRSDPAGECG